MSGMVEALNRAAAVWWDWTLVSTGQGALLLLAVGAVLLAGKSLRPGLRYGLLLVVLVKFAVPPVFGVAYGFSDLLARVLTNDPAPTLSPSLPVTVELAAAPVTAPQAVAVVPFAPQAPELSRLAWLLLMEALGASIVFALVFRQWEIARRLVKRSTQGDSVIEERFLAMVRALRLRRTPQLCLSDEARAPQSGGILRSFVLLPSWAATMPEDELDILLAHELAHVRRMDALANGLQAAAQALLWWNPAVWWLNRRIREEREFCCDDLVLSHGIATGAAYSRTLVNVAERVSLPQSSWAMAGMADNFGAIDRRVRRAMQGGHAQRGWGRYGALAAMLLLAGWVLPGATDGAENGFDAVEAAKVELAFRIYEIKSDKVGRDVNGASRRHGNVSFVVHSPGPMLEALHVTAKGEFLYPNAAGETNKCVVTGEIKATYLGMSFATARLVLDKDGVVDFGKATLDSEAIKGMTSESIVLDLRDGKFAMQDGKADSIKAIKLAERKAKPADLGMDVKAGKMTGNQATGVLTSLEDATVTLKSSAENGDVTIKGTLLHLSDFDKGDGSGVFEGDMQATHSDFSLTATRLERGETLLFTNATLETKDFGSITAEQIRVDLVARRFDILNGTVDEARLKAALGEDAKNAPRGEWLSLPFALESIFKVSATIVEIDRNADFTLPGDEKLADYLKEGASHGIGIVDGEAWSRFEQSIQKEIEVGHAKRLSSPSLTARGGESASITIGEAVAADETAQGLGVSLSATATVHEAENGDTGILLELEYTRGEAGEPVDGKSVVDKSTSQSTVLLPDDGAWCYQVVPRSGDKVDLLCVSAALVRP